MKSAIFYKKLVQGLEKRNDIKIENYFLKYKNGQFEFLKISSKRIYPKDKIIMICAGIHGEEIAGPLTILKYGNKIIDYVYKNGLKIIIYPLVNPSGFERRSRYNIDDDEGDCGNNDFIRYELKNGKIVDDLKDGNVFKKWRWSSDKKIGAKLPLETKLLHRLLKNGPLRHVVGAIDLHQDYITPIKLPAAYHYSFGNLNVYNEIIKKLRRVIPIIKNRGIKAGYDGDALKSDKNGFIVRHDGSWPDLMYRLGAKHCVTVETTGKTPINLACKVNLIWIFGIIDLAAPKI